MKKEATLVVAGYKANLDWLDKIDNPDIDIIIINKGDHTSHPKARCITIPNIGVIDNSVIYYLSTFYNELSDYTIFSQDFPFDHFSTMVEFINSRGYREGFRPLADESIYIPKGDDTTRFIEGIMDVEFEGAEFPCGAQYSVPRSYVHRRPEQFWKDLYNRLPWYTHKFTAYFMERTWSFIYNQDLELNPNYLSTPYFNSVNGKKRLVIANIMMAKNKQSFFALHQALTKLPEFHIEFHILWDNDEYRDEWSDKIDALDCTLVSYTKEDYNQYCLDYGVPQEFLDKFLKFKAIYILLQGHYLKKKGITNYYLIYDDDIVLDDDIAELKQCLENERPCLIAEPMNAGCDKSMANQLLSLYEGSVDYYKAINPHLLGFNAGFQAMSLDMYEDFLEPDYFMFMLNLFNYNGIHDSEGKEITGPERSAIDTQQQSFFSIMNIIRSKTVPHILNLNEYFVCPNWGYHPVYGEIDHTNEFEGWDINMKSKIKHFIGHSTFNGVYYGKAKVFYKLMDEYLEKYNLI